MIRSYVQNFEKVNSNSLNYKFPFFLIMSFSRCENFPHNIDRFSFSFFEVICSWLIHFFFLSESSPEARKNSPFTRIEFNKNWAIFLGTSMIHGLDDDNTAIYLKLRSSLFNHFLSKFIHLLFMKLNLFSFKKSLHYFTYFLDLFKILKILM